MTEKVLRKMLENEIIKEEDYEIYQYGIKNGVIILINFSTILLIGLMTSKLFQLLLFNLVFMTIRSYSGGFHSDSKGMCYLLSSMLQLMPVMAEELFVKCDVKNIIVFMALVVCIIICLCPMNSKNRKLDEKEKAHYGKKAKKMTLIWTIIFGLLYLKKEMVLCNAIFVGISMVAFSMVVGKILLKAEKFA